MVRKAISLILLSTLTQPVFAEQWWIASGSKFSCEVAKFSPDFYLNSEGCQLAGKNESKGIVAISCSGKINANLMYAKSPEVCQAIVDSFKKSAARESARQ